MAAIKSMPEDPFSDDIGFSPYGQPWIDEREDARSLRTLESFHTAGSTTNSQSYYEQGGLPRTDTLQQPSSTSLLPKTHPLRGNPVFRNPHQPGGSLRDCMANRTEPVDEDEPMTVLSIRQDQRLAEARRNQMVNPVPSIAHLPRDGSQNQIIDLLKSCAFWLALLLFLVGFGSMMAAIAIVGQRSQNGETVGAGYEFWIVCSVVVLVIGMILTTIVMVKKGGMGEGFMEKMGFHEVRSRADLEAARERQSLYLGVSQDGSRATVANTSRPTLTHAYSIAESGKTVTICPSAYHSIGRSEWTKLYTAPTPSLYTPHSESSLRRQVALEAHKDSDLGVRQLTPTPVSRRVPSGRPSRFVEDIEMTDFGGASALGRDS